MKDIIINKSFIMTNTITTTKQIRVRTQQIDTAIDTIHSVEARDIKILNSGNFAWRCLAFS